MSECLFFQDSTLVRLVGKDGKGFTTQVLISSASPWIGELMSSISPHGEQCIILPDVAWKDISGLLIQSEPSKAKFDYLLDLFRTTTDNVIHNVKQSRTILQKRVIGNFNDSVKQEECQESIFNEHVKQDDIGETSLNANANLNLNMLMKTVPKVISENKDSSIIDKVVNSSKGTTCNRCEKSFSSVYALKTHKKTIHKVKFEKKDPLNKHIKTKVRSENKDFSIIDKVVSSSTGTTCNRCDKSFSSVYALKTHKKNIHKKDPSITLKKTIHKVRFEKKDTSKSTKYRRLKKLDKILRSPNSHLYELDKIEGILSCNECNQKFGLVKSLKEHKEKHHTVYFSCDYCKFTTTEERLLKSHRFSLHGEIGDVSESCDMCDKKFEGKEVKRRLIRHKRTDHELVRFPCNRCDYRAKTINYLKIHFNSVHEKIILSCEKCDKTYTQRTNLRHHQQSAHNGVFFMCDQCDYKGTRKRNLQHHIEKVHGGT